MDDTTTSTSAKDTTNVLGTPARTWMAALSVAAGVLHLYARDWHAESSTADANAFLIAGMLQLGIAALILAWPRRAVLWGNIAFNAVFIAGWAASRTVGLPYGSHKGIAEDPTTPDLVCVAFELLLILGSGYALRNPIRWAPRARAAVAGAIAAPVLLISGVTSAAIDAHEPSGHLHGEHGHGNDHGMDHGDMDHGHGTEGNAHSMDHGDMEHGHGTDDHDMGDHDMGDHSMPEHDMGDHDMSGGGAGDHDMGDHDMSDHDMGDHDMSDLGDGHDDHDHVPEPTTTTVPPTTLADDGHDHEH